VCICVCLSLRRCVCVYVYVCIHTHTHTHTHTHKYTHTNTTSFDASLGLWLYEASSSSPLPDSSEVLGLLDARSRKKNFRKVSALVYVLYKATAERTFQIFFVPGRCMGSGSGTHRYSQFEFVGSGFLLAQGPSTTVGIRCLGGACLLAVLVGR